MEEEQVVEAIKKAQKGVSKYLEIMELFPKVSVAENGDFRRNFNAFYRVRQRPREWYTVYFSYMQKVRDNKPSFANVLDYLYRSTGRYEPSFSSKLVATLDPDQPVWDIWVIKNTRTRVPTYTSKGKVEEAKAAYQAIQAWYRQFLNSKEGELVVRSFDRIVPEHGRITNLKKADFVLWQMRAN
jgi:hypothetical protein